MIYTVTFNPSIDYFVTVPEFKIGNLNRTTTEQMRAGGKGINVSLVLKNFGVDSTAIGFVAGFTGREVKRLVEESGISTSFLEIDSGNTRINVKVKEYASGDCVETEINGAGPIIKESDLSQLMFFLDTISSKDILVLSGAGPKSASSIFIADICSKMNNKGVKTIVDTSGKALLNAVTMNPFMIKPNINELFELFGDKEDLSEISLEAKKDKCIEYAVKLRNMGAKNVLVSMGKDGAILLAEDGETYGCSAPKGKVINTIGSGDSMVAGFIYSYLEEETKGSNIDFNRILKWSVCAGSASAFVEEFCTKKDVCEAMLAI